MAMGGEDDSLFSDDGQLGDEVGENLAIGFWGGVADGVGEVDGGGAGLDGGVGDFLEKLQFGTRGIFGGEFDVLGVLERSLNGLDTDSDNIFLALFELVIAVDFGGGAEDVYAGVLCGLEGLTGAVDIGGYTSGQSADGGLGDDGGDGLDGVEVAGR